MPLAQRVRSVTLEWCVGTVSGAAGASWKRRQSGRCEELALVLAERYRAICMCFAKACVHWTRRAVCACVWSVLRNLAPRARLLHVYAAGSRVLGLTHAGQGRCGAVHMPVWHVLRCRTS